MEWAHQINEGFSSINIAVESSLSIIFGVDLLALQPKHITEIIWLAFCECFKANDAIDSIVKKKLGKLALQSKLDYNHLRRKEWQ